MWGKRNGKNIGTASLDRIDPTLGYVLENVHWIDKRLQVIKRALSDAVFIGICEEVTLHQYHKSATTSKPPSFSEWVELQF
jgi:hypothetical protein